MNRIIDRDSDSMRKYASDLKQFCDNMNYLTGSLLANCSDAMDSMQDKSGQDAIFLLNSLIEDIREQIYNASNLADNLIKSAELIEEADNYI